MTATETHIENLRRELQNMPFKGQVVDYLGWYDDEGVITESSDIRRRYGIRSEQHCKVYGFKTI